MFVDVLTSELNSMAEIIDITDRMKLPDGYHRTFTGEVPEKILADFKGKVYRYTSKSGKVVLCYLVEE